MTNRATAATRSGHIVADRVMRAAPAVIFAAWKDLFARLCADRGPLLTTGTLIVVELSPHGDGTHLRLRHEGLPDEAARERHQTAWPAVLADLDAQALAQADPVRA